MWFRGRVVSRSCGFVVLSMGLFVQSADVEKDVDSQLGLILL